MNFYFLLFAILFFTTERLWAFTWIYSGQPTTFEAPQNGEAGQNPFVVVSQEVRDTGLSPLEVSRLAPSLQIQGSDLVSTPGAIFVRGSPSDEVLILWNGIELNDPSASGGGASPLELQKEFSHQLQVQTGPQNLLYGPQALAGVVDWQKSAAVSSRLQLMLGTLESQKGLLEWQQPWSKGRWGIGGTSSRAQGLSVSSDPSSSEKDTQSRNTGSAFLDGQLNESTKIELVGFVSDSRNDDDLFGQQDPYARSSSQLQGGRMTLKQQVHPLDWIQLELQDVQSQRENRNDPVTANLGYLEKSAGERTKTVFDWTHNYNFGTTQFHADSIFESMSGTSESSQPTTRFDQRQSIQGVALVTEINSTRSRWGLRWDQYFPRPDVTQKVWSWQWLQKTPEFDKGFEGYFSLSQGHRFPTLYQLYSSFGNSNLNSQALRAYEIGIEKSQKSGAFRAAVFKNDYSEMIDYDLTSQKYQNRGQTQILGLETELHFQTLFDTYHAGLTALQAQDLLQHQDLPRRPRWAGQASWVHQYNDYWSTNLGFYWMSVRPDRDTQGPVQLPESWQGHLVILYRPISNWIYSLNLQNIFNSGSPEIATYTTPPKSAIFTLEYSF